MLLYLEQALSWTLDRFPLLVIRTLESIHGDVSSLMEFSVGPGAVVELVCVIMRPETVLVCLIRVPTVFSRTILPAASVSA